ncbi:MAG: hypothetical protein ACYSUN_09175, partial [Planctomycetota bacterium]
MTEAEEGDVVARGLRIMALKSAKFSGLDFPVEVFKRERRWLEEVTDPATGVVEVGERVARATAIGMLSRIFMGEHPRESDTVRKAADFLLKHLPTRENEGRQVDEIYWWFGTLAMFQVGGTHWRRWNSVMKKAIAAHQTPRGWDPGPIAEEVYGNVGATSLLTMCLEVYYRYDRVFGLGGGKGSESSYLDRPLRGSWRRSSLASNISRVVVAGGKSLPLNALQAQVRVDGFRARVVLDYFFLNDTGSRQEGRFQVRLPDGGSPFYLAFGETALEAGLSPRLPPPATGAALSALPDGRRRSWSKVKEARMVERARAAHAYTTITRERRDPALLEWGGGGIFSARVFPLIPGKIHRIVIGYDVDLLPIKDQLHFAFALPKSDRPALVEFDLDRKPFRLTPSSMPRQVEGRYLCRFQSTRAREFELTLDTPHMRRRAFVLTGTDPGTGTYTVVRTVPRLPREEAACSERAIFMVDTSLSSADSYPVWLRILTGLLDANRDALKEFQVRFFNVDAFPWREGWQANTGENVRALRTYAESVVLEGATDLNSVLRSVRNEEADLFLLSDGAANWGNADLHRVAGLLKGRLFAYRTGLDGTEASTLELLAAETGGAIFHVAGEADLPQAVRAHRFKAWNIESLEICGCTDLIVAGGARTLYPGQTLTIAGRGRPPGRESLLLYLRQGDRELAPTMTLPEATSSPLAPRIYGQIAVDRLESKGTPAPRVAAAFARHFRVVGKTCSLVMLESEKDYRRFGIRPQQDRKTVDDIRIATLLESPDLAPPAPRDLLTRRLRELGDLPEVGFEPAPDLWRMLEGVPDPEFEVEPAGLACRRRTGPREESTDDRWIRARKLEEGRRFADALRLMSCEVEEAPGDTGVLRRVGQAALGLGYPGHAYHLFERASRRRPYDTGVYTELARACLDLGKLRLGFICSQIATSFSQPRFSSPSGALRAVRDGLAHRILEKEKEGLWFDAATQTLAGIGRGESADLVVYLHWDTDGTDVDLHVVDPTGDVCYWRRPRTTFGGVLERDHIDGYGPETFRLLKALPGTYVVRVNCYRPGNSFVRQRTRAFVTAIANAGSPQANVVMGSAKLTLQDEMREVLRVRVEPLTPGSGAP